METSVVEKYIKLFVIPFQKLGSKVLSLSGDARHHKLVIVLLGRYCRCKVGRVRGHCWLCVYEEKQVNERWVKTL